MSHREKKSKSPGSWTCINITGTKPESLWVPSSLMTSSTLHMKQELGKWSQLNSSQPSRNLPCTRGAGKGWRWSHVDPQKLVASAPRFPLESQLEVFSDRIFLPSTLQFLHLGEEPPNNSKYYCCSFSGWKFWPQFSLRLTSVTAWLPRLTNISSPDSVACDHFLHGKCNTQMSPWMSPVLNCCSEKWINLWMGWEHH